MTMQLARLRGPLVMAMVFSLLAVPETWAGGARRGGSGGKVSRPRAPRVSAARRSGHAPAPRPARMPHAAASRARVAKPSAGPVHAKTATGAGTNARTAGTHTSPGIAAAGPSPATYTYGTGRATRHYQAHGYGRGYRNAYSGYRSGYGSSQGNTRSVVSRLRSVHSGLARIDHDYQGHRVRAMHSISLAIRQLSHRSMAYGNSGSSNGNTLAAGRRVGIASQGTNRNRRQPLSQAQSDLRMSQALRTTQGIHMQLSHLGTTYSTGHARARGHLQVAMNEMGHALAVR